MIELHEKYGNYSEFQICRRLSLVGTNSIDSYSYENIEHDTGLTKYEIMLTYSGYEASEDATMKIYNWLLEHDKEFKLFLYKNNDPASYKELPRTLINVKSDWNIYKTIQINNGSESQLDFDTSNKYTEPSKRDNQVQTDIQVQYV
ncbi:hypothetical protein OZX56_05495 [Lactobacillus sp. ESL0684]|uniref:hypothetical protein n=1 Tax=Lactobacillus sp. ESL0684 TaxID=2983213 RepID=UPI0023FA1ACC|nr:hypothetical protein [Lactobacillus sp. ESL0684]WEV43003.1 hypothetical protein OZX56_05495 [Lactobacillus sp. ESL0684]